MTDEELKEEIDKYLWFHSFKLNNNVSIEGRWGTARADMVEGCMKRLDYTDKKVLDIGCRDGYFSFIAEKAGAESVYGIDNCVSEAAVNFLIPYFNSQVKMEELSLYDLNKTDEQFDIIVFAGVLYHLRYPFWALQVIADKMPMGGKMILETAVTVDNIGKAILYCPSVEESPYQDGTSVTFFNIKGLKDTLWSLGIVTDHVEYVGKHTANAGKDVVARACLVCTKTEELPKVRDTYWRGGLHGVLNKSKKRASGNDGNI
jgi:SAM-dependent methyltransferase